MKLNTKFNVNQKVYIKELKIFGTVMSIIYSDHTEYYVRYFNNLSPTKEYFIEDELSNKDEKENLGFKT